MGFDDAFLPVPEIPYESDLYNDAEDALVTLFGADAYTMVGGDGGIKTIEARAIEEADFETLFEGLNVDNMPAIYVHAFGKDEDLQDTAGTSSLPIHVLIAVIQGASDRAILDNNSKRRLGEVERVARQRAGNHGGSGFWAGATSLAVGPSRLHIDTAESKAVGYLTVTITKDVLNRLEAI